MTYEVGQRFTDKTTNEEYILAITEEGKVTKVGLINIDDGELCPKPAAVEDEYDISEEEFSRICDGAEDDFEELGKVEDDFEKLGKVEDDFELSGKEEDDFELKEEEESAIPELLERVKNLEIKVFEKNDEKRTYGSGDVFRIFSKADEENQGDYALVFPDYDEIVLINVDRFYRWGDSICCDVDEITDKEIRELVGESCIYKLIKKGD